MTNINTGLEKSDREQIAAELSKLLASHYTLYIKTQNFHWNVRGPFFQQLHLMFEGQYNELALGNDEIAERIRALGVLAPGSYAQFAKLSFIEESAEDLLAEKMVEILLTDHEKLISEMRKILNLAGDIGDNATEDLIGPKINTHEKTAWMLRSFLDL